MFRKFGSNLSHLEIGLVNSLWNDGHDTMIYIDTLNAHYATECWNFYSSEAFFVSKNYSFAN
jgi:hypothetical protein